MSKDKKDKSWDFDYESMGKAATEQTKSGGGADALDLASTLGMASGHPAAMAAGGVLAGISAVRKQKQKRREDLAAAENVKRQRQVQAMQAMMSQNIGI